MHISFISLIEQGDSNLLRMIKEYVITDAGRAALNAEIERLSALAAIGRRLTEQTEG